MAYHGLQLSAQFVRIIPAHKCRAAERFNLRMVKVRIELLQVLCLGSFEINMTVSPSKSSRPRG
jgi:hypothetical protein